MLLKNYRLIVYFPASEKRGQLSSSDDDSPDVKRPQFNNLTTVLNAYVKDDPSSANSGATYADVAQKLMVFEYFII